MTENEISKKIIDICYKIHVELGPGLFESVYEEILYYELVQAGFKVQRQQPIPVIWKDIKLDKGFKADLIVENKVLIENKSVASITSVNQKQCMTYIKLAGLKLGLLINFNEALIKDGITRIVNNL
ncbi:MAG: GxxExxY protein [Bacteroidales bacterium]